LASLFFACKEPDSIGLKVQPNGDKLNVIYCDTTSLVAYTVKDTFIRTDNTEYNLLGSNNDPVFGKNTASFYSQVLLSTNNPSFGTAPIFDSLILSLTYANTSCVYGDTNSPMTVKVYQMTQSIYNDSAYFSNREFMTSSTPLATKTFVPRPSDSATIGDVKYAPQLRIPLSKSLLVSFSNATNTTSFADNTNFLQFFNGIYVTATPASGNGSIISFDLLNPNSEITLYYHNSTDTSSFSFVTDNGGAERINHFDHSKYLYANPYLLSELTHDSIKNGNNVLYVQSMAGLQTRIEFPYIQNLVKKGKIAINKAQLVIPVDDSADISLPYYAPPYELVLVEEYEGLDRYLVDQSEGTSYYGGIYNSGTKEYVFNIALYLQRVLDGVEPNLGLYLEVWTADRPSTPNRVVIKGPKRHSGLSLNITYTKLY
jgi:hypothetical protein